MSISILLAFNESYMTRSNIFNHCSVLQTKGNTPSTLQSTQKPGLEEEKNLRERIIPQNGLFAWYLHTYFQ